MVDIDVDKWGLQNLRELMRNLNYEHECVFWWHHLEDNKLLLIADDDVAMCLAYSTLDKMDKTARVYVEHASDMQINGENVHDVSIKDSVDEEDSDESYHPIGQSDEDPDDDLFDKYVDNEVSNTHLTYNLNKSTYQLTNEEVANEDDSEIDSGYESDYIDAYVADSEDEETHQIRRLKYKSIMMKVDFKFEVGMEFDTLDQFKDAIREWNVLNGRGIKFSKNDKTRVRAVCKDKCCDWVVFLSKVGNMKSYLVKTVNMKHTCQFVYNNKTANTAWVAKKIMDDVSMDPKYKLKTIVQKIGKDSNLGISLCKAQRAKKKALDMLIGSQKDQYAKMWSYLEEMKKASIENSCGMKVQSVAWSHRPQFQRVYVCFEACKKGFKAACRTIIGIDGCFLTGDYGGQLLTAVGVDPNNQYFPIAWAIVEVENTDSWRWFLNLLLDYIGGVQENKWVFISDQQKGLMTVLDEILHGMEHRFCLRHMYNNFRKKWPGGEYHGLIEAAARAPYEQLFLHNMDELKKLSIDAYNWLNSVPRSAWCRHAFSCHAKSDVLLNNECESFNGRLIPGRDQGPLGLLEFIREYVMNKFVENMHKVSRYRGKIMPKIKKKLEQRIASSSDWIAKPAGNHKWEVSNAYGKRHVVDLQSRLCSCKSYQLCGIPCPHAVKAIYFEGGDIEDYVSHIYSRDAYVACYNVFMSPMDGEELWPETTYPPPLPPPFRRKPGRPKKLRRREPNDGQGSSQISNVNKLSKKSMLGRCSKCGEIGHNRRSCNYMDDHNPKEKDFSQRNK